MFIGASIDNKYISGKVKVGGRIWRMASLHDLAKARQMLF
jgi:hypothetical protein